MKDILFKGEKGKYVLQKAHVSPFRLPRAPLLSPPSVLITPLGFSFLWELPHLASHYCAHIWGQIVGAQRERGEKSIVCFPHLVGITATLMRELSPSQSFGSGGLFVVSVITAMRLLMGWWVKELGKRKKGNFCTLSSLGVPFPAIWSRTRGLLKLSCSTDDYLWVSGCVEFRQRDIKGEKKW